MRIPALFVSHGSPELAIRPTAAHRFLKGYAAHLPRPRAILAVSAHWETTAPTVGTGARPETVYDFRGFDTRLYQIRYPAPGAPDLARRVAELLEEQGFTVAADAHRGWDHGVWVPLVLLFPAADIPVVQLSIQPAADPEHHWRLGQALQGLRAEGVLILTSGAITHNLHEFFGRAADAPAPAWVTSYNTWMHEKLETGDVEALLSYRAEAPHAERNHPEHEHLLPLYLALGATTRGEPIRRVHASYEHGVLAMDVYRFGA
jgi:4,5-DOPA dioxygenase extradiol